MSLTTTIKSFQDIMRKDVGVADVRAFGLTWEDCEALLGQLGYKARVEISTN